MNIDVLEYRVIDPDTNIVYWTCRVPTGTGQIVCPPVDQITPPWRYEYRFGGVPHWTLIEEATRDEHRAGRGRNRSNPYSFATGGPIATSTTGTSAGTNPGLTNMIFRPALGLPGQILGGAPGQWLWANLHTALPANTVKESAFTDPWPLGWTAGGVGSCTITQTRNTTTVEGFHFPHIRVNGRVMLGWQSMDNTSRVIATTAYIDTPTITFRRGWRATSAVVENSSLLVYLAGSGATMSFGGPLNTPPRKVAGAYRGWRAWTPVSRNKGAPVRLLAAITNEYVWQPGWNEATNYQPTVGAGGGGFYAVDAIRHLVDQDAGYLNHWLEGGRIWGSIIATGRMIKGSKGVRASHARPESIILTGKLDTDATLLTIADRYHMTVIDNIGKADDLPAGLIDYTEEDDP